MINFTGPEGKALLSAWIKGRRIPTQYEIFRVAGSGAMLGLPLVAYSASQARDKEKLATAASGAVGIFTYPAMAAGITWGLGGAASALSFLLPNPVGSLTRAGLAGLGLYLASGPNRDLQSSFFDTYKSFSKLDLQTRRLEMGFGMFKDSPTMQRARISSIQEMSSAMQPMRKVLGRESSILHK